MAEPAPVATRPRRPRDVVSVEPEPTVTVWIAAAIYFALALFFFIPAFLPGQQIYGTDYIGGAYYFYDFIADRLHSGALPKWVPYVFGGLPLFANPGSTFQPVHFVMDFLLPTERALAAVFVVQFWLAGLGMFLLARELRCRPWIALVAGIAFQFTGIIIGWVYAGHDGRIIVATLTPLFFYFLHRGTRTGSLIPFAGAAATLGAALLSFQIQNSYYMLLGGGIWGVFCLAHHRSGRRPVDHLRIGALGLGSVAVGFMLAAVNFLPFLGYVAESPRGMEGGRGYEYSTSFSMPPSELLSMAVPEHHGASIGDPRTGEPLFPAYRGTNPFKLHTEYVGAFTLVLLALGFAFSRRDPYWLFLGALAVFMITIALGGNTPLYRLYYELLPGTQRFRAPSLSFFVAVVCLVAMAARTLERIAELRASPPGPGGAARGRGAQKGAAHDDPLRTVAWIAGSIVALGALGVVFTGGEPGGGPSISLGWARWTLFAGLVGGAIWMWSRARITTVAVAILLALVTFADLWIIGRRFLHTVDPPAAIFAADDVIRFLQAQQGPERIWTFPIPEHYRGAGAYGGNFPMLFGLEQVGGEHPNMLQRWVEYVGPGTQTYIDWNNLLARAEVVEGPEGQAISFAGRPGFLDAANVRYLVSMAPLWDPALREVHRGSALVYENLRALPRAYLVPEARAVPEGTTMVAAMSAEAWDPRRIAFVPTGTAVPEPGGGGEARVVSHEADRVVVSLTAAAPSVLVLADNYYAGWRARIDGRDAEVFPANHTFRGVVVPAGTSTVEFTFEPPELYRGLWISLGTLLVLLGVVVVLLVRARREDAAVAGTA
jgi:hypothetical protein